MAFSGITKLISQLTESASASDTDNLIIGGSDAKKITFSNFKKAILNISNLSSTTSISDTDNLIVGNTDAKKITWAQIIALIKTKLNIGNEDISGIGDGTVTGAIAGLNENLTNKIQYREIQVEIGNGNNLPEGGFSSGAVDVSTEFPSAKKVVAIGGRQSRTQYVCNATIENNTTMYCNAVSAGVYYVTIIGFY